MLSAQTIRIIECRHVDGHCYIAELSDIGRMEIRRATHVHPMSFWSKTKRFSVRLTRRTQQLHKTAKGDIPTGTLRFISRPAITPTRVQTGVSTAFICH